ncbi:hypothetical protein BHUM_05272 [Candidatus Burkholderia humilis]|nr:hypothetical protein BHUM_05272 [Candidatus Burkholderia humilis]
MKVSSLIAKLSTFDPDAEILLLSGCADISEAVELICVEPQSNWRCEVHFRDDGQSNSFHAPLTFGATHDYDLQYDKTVNETVVLLAGHTANLDYMFEDDFAPAVRKLSPDWIERETIRKSRKMLEDGTLISRELLLRLLCTSVDELNSLVARGCVFEVCIDGLPYYPSVFANPRINARRLQSVSRLLQPLSASAKLDFLLSEWQYLDSRRPIEMLEDLSSYGQVRRYAKVRTQESSRTAVRFFTGLHQSAPSTIEPLYTSIAELDPRRPLWSRARAALSEYGFQFPHSPYPCSALFTVFVEKMFEGKVGSVPEGLVCIHGMGGTEEEWRIAAAWPYAGTTSPDEPFSCEGQDVVSVAKAAFEHLKRLTGNNAS